MGFLSSLFGDDDAPRDAAAAQVAASNRAIDESRQARAQAREDLSGFREAGEAALPGLQSLVTDPNAQLDFVQNNPFFEALTADADRKILSNSAARGKVGSGDTAKALRNSQLLLGTDLVNNSINQRQNLATIGQNAAAGQASATLNTSSNIGELLTGIGNANASGIIGASNARQAGIGNIGSLITGGLKLAKEIPLLKLSDRRYKTNIRCVGQTHGGTPVYTYNYAGDDTPQMGVMADEVPHAVTEVNGVKYVDYARVR